MKSMVRLSTRFLEEIGYMAGTSTARDIKEVVSRTSKEGLSFFTITLPAFEKSLMNCIESGYLRPDSFPGWEKKNGAPKFLGGLLSKIFTKDGLSIIDLHTNNVTALSTQIKMSKMGYEDDVDKIVTSYYDFQSQRGVVAMNDPLTEDQLSEVHNAIVSLRLVRCFTLLLSKVEMECTPKRTKAALDQYIDTDKEIKDIPLVISAGSERELVSSLALICGNVTRLSS